MVMLEFDPAKDRENVRKHRISLARFAEMDEDSWLQARDERDYEDEERWIIFGFSLRPATRRERTMYDEAQK